MTHHHHHQNQDQSFVSVFFSKLKDQSFTIILMLGILYYQNMMWNKDHGELDARITKLDAELKECHLRERTLYVDKGEALKKQREEFIKILREITEGSGHIPAMMPAPPEHFDE